MSQETLADLADIDRSYMSSVERGLRNISVLSLASVAKALDVPLVELIGSIDSPASAPIEVPPTLSASQAETVAPSADEGWEPGGYLSLS